MKRYSEESTMQTKATTQERLDDLLRDFADLGTRTVGYPCNLDFDYHGAAAFPQIQSQ